MKLYWQSIDWLSMWETFRDTIGSTGLPVYRTIPQFIHKVVLPMNSAQEEFLFWYLGPDTGNEALAQKFIFAGSPLDWRAKRDSHGSWWNDDTKAMMEKKIRAHVNALDFMREHSNQTLVGQSAALANLSQEIFKAIGPVIREDLTEEQARDRMEKWLNLYKDVLKCQAMTQGMILKSLGLDGAQGEGVSTLIIQTAINAQMQGDPSEQTRLGMYRQVMDMTHLKAERLKCDPPEGFPKVVNVTSSPVDDKHRGGVQ
jgi:hypothetical protein